MTGVCVATEYCDEADPEVYRSLVGSNNPFTYCLVFATPKDKISEFSRQLDNKNILVFHSSLNDSNLNEQLHDCRAEWVILLEKGARLDFPPVLNFKENLGSGFSAYRIRTTDALGMSRYCLQMSVVGPSLKLAGGGKSLVAPKGEIGRSISLSINLAANAGFVQAKATENIESGTVKGDSNSNLDLARSHEVMGNADNALELYKLMVKDESVSMETRWYAWYRIILITRGAEADRNQICSFCEEAFNVWPERAETLVILAGELRNRQDVERALELLNVAEEIGMPADEFYFDYGVYDIGIKVERMECEAILENHASVLTLGNEVLAVPRRGEVRNRVTALRDDAFAQVFPLVPLEREVSNEFLIIVTFRNAGEFLQKCIDSIKIQEYKNYRVVFVDDASNDGALRLANFEGLSAFKTIINDQSLGAISNQSVVMEKYADIDEIAVFLDGDDWFSHENVLETLNTVYGQTDCWVTYGQFQCSNDNSVGYPRPLLPGEDVADAYRKGGILFPVHLRTYRTGLHLKIAEQDPEYNCFKDADGKYLDYAYDVAQMRAVMLLAGTEKIRYIPEILYTYNTSNPLSHFATARPELDTAMQYICSLPELKVVPNYTPECKSRSR